MSRPVLVALLDGPLPDGHPALKQRIVLAEGSLHPAARLHAEAMAAAMMRSAPSIEIVNLQIFGPRLTTDAKALSDAFGTAAALKPQIVHCSFGLQRRDAAVAAAVAALQKLGAGVVAAAPARGGPSYPAALPEVIPVQGDARCGPDDWSHLALPTALFGAHAQSLTTPEIRGASIAAAHLSGLLAAQLATGLTLAEAVAHLRAKAHFQGREHRLT